MSSPGGDQQMVSGWILQENLVHFCRLTAHYTDTTWPDAEDERMVSALPDTDVDAGRWSRHPIWGDPPVVVSVAQDDSDSVYIVEVSGALTEVLAARLDTMIDLL